MAGGPAGVCSCHMAAAPSQPSGSVQFRMTKSYFHVMAGIKTHQTISSKILITIIIRTNSSDQISADNDKKSTKNQTDIRYHNLKVQFTNDKILTHHKGDF